MVFYVWASTPRCLHFFYNSRENNKQREENKTQTPRYERIMEMKSQLNRLQFIPRNYGFLVFTGIVWELRYMWKCQLKSNGF